MAAIFGTRQLVMRGKPPAAVLVEEKAQCIIALLQEMPAMSFYVRPETINLWNSVGATLNFPFGQDIDCRRLSIADAPERKVSGDAR